MTNILQWLNINITYHCHVQTHIHLRTHANTHARTQTLTLAHTHTHTHTHREKQKPRKYYHMHTGVIDCGRHSSLMRLLFPGECVFSSPGVPGVLGLLSTATVVCAASPDMFFVSTVTIMGDSLNDACIDFDWRKNLSGERQHKNE